MNTNTSTTAATTSTEATNTVFRAELRIDTFGIAKVIGTHIQRIKARYDAIGIAIEVMTSHDKELHAESIAALTKLQDKEATALGNFDRLLVVITCTPPGLPNIAFRVSGSAGTALYEVPTYAHAEFLYRATRGVPSYEAVETETVI